jgi:hypothetical protein
LSKYLIILGIISLLFYLLLFWRMRRYLPLVRRIFGLTRDIYRMTKNTGEPRTVAPQKRSEGGKLVRCAACGTWIPTERAIQLRAKPAVYCSTACLEKAAAEPRPARRSSNG